MRMKNWHISSAGKPEGKMERLKHIRQNNIKTEITVFCN
jgi:hypothetical protein